jgi:uncharacterized membrane protein YgcG
MSASDVLKDFQRKRRTLYNLREQNAVERLTAMWKFLDSNEETHLIIENIYHDNSEISARVRENMPLTTESEEGTIVAGLYAMEACRNNIDSLFAIGKNLGIKYSSKGYAGRYIEDVMEAFVDHALNFIEDELERMTDKEKASGRKDNTKVDNSRQYEQLPQKILDEGKATQDKFQGLFNHDDGRDNNFEKVKKMMPQLLEEMREDISSEENRLIREFAILPNRKVLFNYSKRHFSYFADEHEDLRNKIDILEDYGFVTDVTTGNTPIYRMREEFLGHLREAVMSEDEGTEGDESSGGQQGVFAKDENQLAKAFMEFLENDRGYPRGSIKLEVRGLNPTSNMVMDMVLIIPETGETAAVIEFRYSKDAKTILNATEQLNSYCKNVVLGKPYPLMYIVFPTHEKTSKPFEIHEVKDSGFEMTLSPINDFPTYDELKAKERLNREIVSPLVEETEKRAKQLRETPFILKRDSKTTDLKSNVFVYSASNNEAQKRYKDTVVYGVKLEKVLEYVTDPEIAEDLKKNYSKGGVVYLWAAQSEVADGANENKNIGYWNQMKYGDWVLAYSNSLIISASTIISKVESKQLGEVCWPNPDRPYDLIFFLSKPTHVEKPIEEIKNDFGKLYFGKSYLGLRRVRKSSDIIRDFGTITNFIIEALEGDVETDLGKEDVGGAGHGLSDVKTDDDSLGFRPYVEAVAEFLTHKNTEPPLVLSVEGEWGSGKSSFMWQLENEIEKQNKQNKKNNLVVKFDPWRHDKDESLWAAFALKFLEEMKIKGSRKVGDFQLFCSRFDWKEGKIDFAKCCAFWALFSLLSVFIVVLIFQRGTDWVSNLGGLVCETVNEIEVSAGKKIWQKFIEWTLGGTGLAGIASVMVLLLKLTMRLTGNPLTTNLKKYIKQPDYEGRVSFIERFHDDFNKIINAYTGDNRVYVFIDDLDRCAVPKAAELMESINLMISDSPRLVFIMGMDREKVAAGLAVKHEKLLPYLSGKVEQLDGKETDGKKKETDKDEEKRLRGIRYGYSFLEKFIQIPFYLPQPNAQAISNLLKSLPGQAKEESVAPTGTEGGGTGNGGGTSTGAGGTSTGAGGTSTGTGGASTGTGGRKQGSDDGKDQIDEIEGDTKRFREMAEMVASSLGNNPRRVKQFVGLLRLRLRIADKTGLLKEDGGREHITFEQLGKFVGIGLGWPLLMREIEQEPLLLNFLARNADGDKDGKVELRYERWANNNKLTELLKAGEGEDYRLGNVDVRKLLYVSPGVRGVD